MRLLALVLGAMLIVLGAFALLRMPERSPRTTAPTVVSTPERVIAGIDKGSLLAGASVASQAEGAVAGELATAQVAFLREAAKKEAGEWRDLGEADQDQQRAALKASMLEGR